MCKFIFNLTVVSTLVGLSFLISGVKLESKKKQDYLAAIIDKHNYLKSYTGKRLILAGGSNLAFGIDSPLIESSMGIPAINLGLHAGLGLDFIINELSSVVRDGDIVFLSVELFLDKNGDYKMKKKITEFLPEAENYFNVIYCDEISYWFFENKINIFNNLNYIISPYRKNNIRVIDSIDIYSRKNFNKNGDMIGHFNLKSSKKLSKYRLEYRYYEGIDKLNSFYKTAQSKNVKVYFLYPNFVESQYIEYNDAIKKYTIDLESALKIPIINKSDTFVLNDSLFFDTAYHLNKSGREIRTKRLLKYIEKYVPHNLNSSMN